MSQLLMAKKTKGRRKMELTKIPDEGNRRVTFSKRRSGLFKKANELCTLTGALIGLVVFTPSAKAFSFGHPSVEAITDRFLFESYFHGASSSAATQPVGDQSSPDVRVLNVQLKEVMNLLELEKRRGDELNRKMLQDERCWWKAPIEELSKKQLQELEIKMGELKNFTKDVEKYSMVQAPNPYYANPSATSFYGQSSLGTGIWHYGFQPQIADVRVPGLGLSMVPPQSGSGIPYGGYGHASSQGPGTWLNGTFGQIANVNVPGLGLSMAPHGPPPGLGFGGGYGDGHM